MDGPDDESIELYERYVAALRYVAWELRIAAIHSLTDDVTSFGNMRRHAFINAAINFNKAVLAKINPSFPGVDLIDLAEKVRLQVVIDRLDGDE